MSQPAEGVPSTNSMAIAALVFAFVFPPLGAVFGHVAKRQIRRTGEGGSGLATAGMIVGYLLTALYLVLCCGSLAVGGLTTYHNAN